MSRLTAAGFPEDHVRARARDGAAAALPSLQQYGRAMFGAHGTSGSERLDLLDSLRIVPPVFMPQRLEKLIELGREPLYTDVDLRTDIGGLRSPLPVLVSALGSTDLAHGKIANAVARQAGRRGIPVVMGENIVPSSGYGRLGDSTHRSLSARIRDYCKELPDATGGIAVQQSTEDADAEVWNLVYSDPSALPLLESGRLAFELKVGQGAKPGLGGMAVVDAQHVTAADIQFTTDAVFSSDATRVLRSATPGTFTHEILHRQIVSMRNNFPRARIWVKLLPGRDIRSAAEVAWAAGADAVTVDGAESGTGWAPLSFLEHVGLPLAEALLRVGRRESCLIASGRMWEGTRAVKALALGARAVGVGRAAFLAVDEDPEQGLLKLLDCFGFELRLLISALGKYSVSDVAQEDLWGLPGAVQTSKNYSWTR
ncbi:glutamate synthase-related protein [Streptomyces sp. NBC_00829]|uniref:glutamate synthase-related protein n=1 Tax=Streptomyces sp. NBC_00829 TaxID=2903679 RepID=UPI002F919953|nr:glutamate synthase-related protein [Streptomyces sp. NBC_00829]